MTISRARKLIATALAAMIIVSIVVPIGASAEPARDTGRDYYVSISDGNDGNDGSLAAPWKTLTNVNDTEFQPGDHIYFKAGDEWRGQINFKGFGTDDNPIIVDFYGDKAIHGNLTDYPAVHGMGGEGLDDAGKPISPAGHFEQGYSGTIMMVNTTNWQIRHLQVTNDNMEANGTFEFRNNIHSNFRQRFPNARTQGETGHNTTTPYNTESGGANSARPNMAMNLISFNPVTRRAMNERNGIMLILNPDVLPGEHFNDFSMRNVSVEDMYIHDVDGIQYWNRQYADARFQGAIMAFLEGSSVPGMTFENLTIKGNVMNKVGTMAIATFDFSDHDGFQDYYRAQDRMMKNVYIGYNYMTNILGGIFDICNVDGSQVEYNVGDHWGRDYSRECAGMYTWQGNNVTYAHNIVSNGPNRLGNNGGDGSAWDIDSGLYNVIHEFNYTYNNPMGTLSWLGRNYGSLYRYNITDNDKRGFIIHGYYGSDFDDTYITNNIFFFDSTKSTTPGTSQGNYETAYRFCDPSNTLTARTSGGVMYLINNVFYDFGNQNANHWFFQNFGTAANYGSTTAFTAGSIWRNNAFYFARMGATLTAANLRANATTAAVGPWSLVSQRQSGNLVQVNPGFVGISGTWTGIPDLPGSTSALPMQGRPTLTVEPKLPGVARAGTPGHAGQPFPVQLGKVMDLSDPFWGKFKLQPNSPLIDAGIYVPQMGLKDFYGNDLYYGSAPDIGVHEVAQGTRTVPTNNITNLNPGGGMTPKRSGNLARRKQVTTQNSNNIAYFLTDEMILMGGGEDNRNIWNSGNSDPSWIEIDFGAPTTFTTVRLYEETLDSIASWTGTTGGNQMKRPHLVHYTYSRWDDTAKEWIPFFDNAPNLYRAGSGTATSNYITDAFNTVTSSKLRIDLDEMNGVVYFREIEVFNDSTAKTTPSRRTDLAASATRATGSGYVEFTLPATGSFNRLRLTDAGGAVTGYTASVQIDGEWVAVGSGGKLVLDNVFFKDLVALSKTSNKIRIDYEASGTANIGLGVYLENGYIVQKEVAPALVASYSMERSGANIIDTSGNGRSMTSSNVTFVDDPDRGIVAYLGNKGTNTTSYLQLLNASVPAAMNNTYTISMWLKPDGPYMLPFAPTNGRSAMTLYSKGADSSETFCTQMFYNGQSGQFQSPHRIVNLTATGADGTGQIRYYPTYQGSTDPINNVRFNKWNHVVFTYDGYAFRTYVNGKMAMENVFRDPYNETARGLRSNTTNMLFGKRATTGNTDQYFGYMDDITLFSTALTQEQILTMFDEKADLAKAIADFGELSRFDWTAASWSSAFAAYCIAMDVYEDADASKLEINKATADLNKAIADLVARELRLADGQPAMITVRRGATATIAIVSNCDVIFTSAVPVFATVNQTGVVTGLMAGISVIRISDPESGLTINVPVNVVN